MPALTQCWYTRAHVPDGRRRKTGDGAQESHCRHCGKRITSWDGRSWHPADGFNVSRLAETANARFLYLIDVDDDVVIARFLVAHLEGEQAIAAYREELRRQHGLDEPGCTIELRDSMSGTGGRRRRSAASAARPFG